MTRQLKLVTYLFWKKYVILNLKCFASNFVRDTGEVKTPESVETNQ